MAEVESVEGRGPDGDGETARGAARCGGGRGRGELDAEGAIGMGIESWMVGRSHWRGIGRVRPDAIHWCGI